MWNRTVKVAVSHSCVHRWWYGIDIPDCYTFHYTGIEIEKGYKGTSE